jgi:hypothetical protein
MFAGVIYGPDAHYVDHLAPLCAVLDIPLVVTEGEIEESLRRSYPMVKTQFVDSLSAPETLIQNYAILFTCMPRLLCKEIFFFAEHFHRRQLHTVWCPHGNSDKGQDSPFMEGLRDEEAMLVYGPKMVDFLIEKQVLAKTHVAMGNYRFAFYQEHRPFFDSLFHQKVGRRGEGLRTILYAPTWDDHERSSSFFSACHHMIEKLSGRSTFLIVKLHPNLLRQAELKVMQLIDKYEGRENVVFMTDFSPIYPLLQATDIYIGDASSIGYDFLTFNKPMFFLNQNRKELYLHRCGTVVMPEEYDAIDTILENSLKSDTLNFSAIRKETYTYTFGKPKPLSSLRHEIRDALKKFEDELL